jgi:hypothetical protein
MQPISPPIDPQAHRAAIDALEAQRAAYRRFARQAEAQQNGLSGGDVAQVDAFTEGAGREIAELQEGARAVRSLVDAVSPGASVDQLREIERRMVDMMREARLAEMAIHNLTTQLEAWRDAYGRQLAELGLTPGGESAGDAPDPSRRGYGGPAAAPRILDRRG